MGADRLALPGCSPTPLASYLKALGVLRLLSSGANHVSGEPADPDVRGWWRGEHFWLRTKLGKEGLIEFFLRDYAPSPVIAPWNGGSGFYAKDNRDGFSPLGSPSAAERFRPFSETIRIATETLRELDMRVRPQGAAKARLVSTLRARLPDSALPWLDAALVLSGDRLRFPQLLGTGGNDGRLDFTNNFMRRLASRAKPPGIFDASTGRPSGRAAAMLDSALFDEPIQGLTSVAVGQFSPGAAGGPNATTGYEGDPTVNSWDYALMLEGAATFACAATRRHQSSARAKASFPFTVGASGAGWGGVEATDESDARAEFWAPLWTRPARFREIEALFGEGRAVTNGRTARDGLDFARALSTLGVSRGFSEFQRYGIFKRAGKNHYAAALARRPAAPSRGAVLLADLDEGAWLNRVRRVARSKNHPAAMRRAVKGLEDSLFELIAPDVSAGAVAGAIDALGRLGSWLGSSPDGRESVAPPPLLARKWLRRADDCTPEFRVAAALAALGIPEPSHVRREDSSTPVESDTLAPPMAAHLAPLTNGRREGFEARTFFRERHLRKRRTWAADPNPPIVVWGHGALVANMIAVLERRLLEASVRGLEDKPFAAAGFARISDVAAFIAGEFDDARCSRLLAGMVWAKPARLPGQGRGPEPGRTVLPFAYSALKPIFSTETSLAAADAIPAEKTMPVPPGLVGLLRAATSTDGRATNGAVRMAFARARASGLVSPFDNGLAGPARKGRRIGAGVQPDRLAAAMLIPISTMALRRLLDRAYPDPYRDEKNHSQEEHDVR